MTLYRPKSNNFLYFLSFILGFATLTIFKTTPLSNTRQKVPQNWTLSTILWSSLKNLESDKFIWTLSSKILSEFQLLMQHLTPKQGFSSKKG